MTDGSELVTDKLRKALQNTLQYIPWETVRCRGDKCREPWCESCCGEDEAERGIALAKEYRAAAIEALGLDTSRRRLDNANQDI